MVSNVMPSEGSQVMHIHLRFPALPHTGWDLSEFPESFHNSIYGSLWKTSILCDFVLRILICLTFISWNLAQSGFTGKDWDAPFIPKHDPPHLPIHLRIVDRLKTV